MHGFNCTDMIIKMQGKKRKKIIKQHLIGLELEGIEFNYL